MYMCNKFLEGYIKKKKRWKKKQKTRSSGYFWGAEMDDRGESAKAIFSFSFAFWILKL